MRRGKRIFRFFGLALVSAFGLGLAVLSVLILHKPLTKRILLSYFSRRTGAVIAAQRLDFRLFPLRVEVDGLKATGTIRGQNLDLELGRVEAGGSLGGLISRTRPLFSGISAEDAQLRIKVDPTRRQKIDWQSLSESLRRLGPLQIRKASAEMIFPGGQAEMAAADLNLRSSGKPGAFVFSLSTDHTAFASDREEWSLAGSLHFEGEIQLDGRPALRGNLTIGSLRGSWKKIDIPPLEEIAIRVLCEHIEEENRLSFSEFDVSLTSLARAGGPLQVQMGKKPSLIWNLRAALFPAAIIERLKPELPSWPVALEAGGEISLEGELRYTRDLGPRTEVRLKASFANALLSYSGREYAWRSSVSGSLNIEGSFPRIEAAGRLAAEKGELTVGDHSIQGLSARLGVRLTPSFLFLPSVRGSAEAVRLRLGKEEVSLAGVKAAGQGRLERRKKRIVFDSVELEGRDFSPFQAHAEFGMEGGGQRSIRVRNPSLDLGRTLRLFHPVVPAGVASWNPEGTVSFHAEAEEIMRPERKWQIHGEFSADRLQLDHPEFAAAAAGLVPEIRFSGGYSPSRRTLSLDCSFSLAGGESLWREFYIDWAAHPLRGKWRGEFHFFPPEAAVEALEFSLLPVGRVSLTGWAKAGNPLSFDFQASASVEDPASLLALIGGPLGNAGFAAALNGRLAADVRAIKAGDSFSLAGLIGVQNGGIEGKASAFVLSGVEARIPFRYRRGSEGATDEEFPAENTGYLQVASVGGFGLALGPLRLDLSSFSNRWLVQPVSLDLWGGRASFGATTLTLEPRTLRVHGRTSLVFRNGDLARMFSSRAGGFLTGGFEADFPSVEITPERITLQGEAGGSLYSGRWTLRNLRLERPFRTGRTVRCDISFDGLDLEQMTNALPFGRVTGIVKGEIEGLSLSYGQTESFRFRLESVRKEGVRQTFSLRAVDSLTVLSQGEGPVPSQAFFLRFVPAFPYEKIGIRCSLRNDIFQLGGMIVEGGVEYLVRRARPFGISIVNRDPNKLISYKDMVGRLKRIGAAKAT